ncbi:NAD-dependent epimerase/dehydratase family protein [Actinomadura sp. 9N407]|uniref:NAD-dependent epimerase/dehydratase family protein n=1 Tax=Actinomadura sp. 9N407 TaxID=3375154 RepID=UPI00378E91B7
MGLTVAVTGPTGEIGTSVIHALERDQRVDRVAGMARRPFDPASRGWHKTEYRQGDILDRSAVDDLVAGADVVVHLAYVIVGSHQESERVNLAGTRNVFEATGSRRLVYTSSVAAYGYHKDNPVPITEDVPARGSSEHYYSAQKAACEKLLAETDVKDAYVLRPCIVAGPEATVLLRNMPWNRAPKPLRRLLGAVPGLHPVLPDPGTRFQLVHQEDVASAVVAAVAAEGPPGAYNLAADGDIGVGEFAQAIGAYTVPVPRGLVGLTAELVNAFPYTPAQAEWIHAVRHPMLVDTTKARRDLHWTPAHTTQDALKAMTHPAP